MIEPANVPEPPPAPLLCRSRDCKQLAVCLVLWPGQTTRLCGFCTIRALNVAAHMGFQLSITLDDGRPL